MQEEQEVTSSSIIIPLDKVQKYAQLINLQSKTASSRNTNKLLELRECLESKPKTVYGAYSSESLIKLFRVIEDNSLEFMQVYAINTSLNKESKKEFSVDKMLREYCEFSFEEMLFELHYIRQSLRDKDIYKELVNWLKSMLSKVKYLLYKHCEVLVSVLGECLNFYIRRSKNSQTDRYEYSVVIALDKVCVSFCSSNEYCENIMHSLMNKLREHCMMDGYDFDEREFELNDIESADNNFFDIGLVPESVLEAYERKEVVIEEMINFNVHSLTMESSAEAYYTQLLINTFVKYAEDVFCLIEGTIVFLSNLVLEKKQLKSIAYDEQFISMRHPSEQKTIIEETFMNLYCEHFEGLPEDMYKNGGKCLYCGEPIIVDEIKCFERNRNLFQNMLKRNFLNPNSDNVIYYFKDKIFSLANKDKFSSYAHYCQFVKRHCFLRDRPDNIMLLETEKISLYSKLWGKKKLFTSDELIMTPVRGKYCRHLEFFELMRVYEKYIQRQENETSFECFLCFEPIEYDEIIYLHEIKLLIDLAKSNFYPSNDCLLNTYIEISHEHETVELCCELEKGYMKKSYELPIYNTLIDPLTKSERGLVEEKGNKKEEEGEFEYTEEFSYFFFGF